MQPMSLLITTCILFVGSHLALSHPLRDGLAGRLGERGFQITYSVVAIATFILIVQAWRGMP
ncbi:MAG TPA: NnrU family protein, partial [Sphingopyxis sp.]|nr:NnrU family protein [Sphingopyxis sp.]